MGSFLGGWFDIEAGRHDEIEGIGKMILFPLEFFSDLLEDAKDDIRELKKSPEARLQSLERRYQNEGIKQQDIKTQQSKIQKFVLANKEKVKERLEMYKEDFRDGKDLVKELAYEGLCEFLESKTYNQSIQRFQDLVNRNEKEEKEPALMKPKTKKGIEKLEQIGKSLGGEIYYAEIEGGNGIFRLENGQPKIYIQSELDTEKKAVSLAHELGHLKDFRENFSNDLAKFTDAIKNNPLELEKTAWINSVDTLKQNNAFKNWDYFLQIIRENYRSYAEDVFPPEQAKQEVDKFMKEVEKQISKRKIERDIPDFLKKHEEKTQPEKERKDPAPLLLPKPPVLEAEWEEIPDKPEPQFIPEITR